MMSSLLALAAAALAPAAATAPLEPAGPWQVDYGDSQCIAGRAYAGKPGHDIILGFIPAPVLGGAQIVIIRDQSVLQVIQRPLHLQNGDTQIDASIIDYPVPKSHKSIGRMNLRPDQYAALAHDGSLRVRFGTFDQRFALYNMAGVAKELDSCVKDLNALWTMTPEREARIKTRPKPVRPLASYFSTTNYPQQALRERNTGRVTLRMMVDEKGDVKNCVATETSGSALLDAVSCFVLQGKAKFAPAIDIEGKPTRSYYDEKVAWVIHSD